MKVLQINTVYPNGSTGKICEGILNACKTKKIENIIAYGYSSDLKNDCDSIAISTWLDNHIHNRLAHWTMLEGFFSKIRTYFFLKKVKKYSPDIVHLHNIHGNYINIKMLFRYIKKNDCAVVWTLHDCWSFTGWCAYYTANQCQKWLQCCNKCICKKQDRIIKFDNSKRMFLFKKNIFTNNDNIVLVTPSEWLMNEVSKSFMKCHPVRVINNGIDLNVFKITKSDFRKKYDIEDKFIILGVAFDWGYRKGLDIFIELSSMIDDRYQIVLVGTNNKIDKILPSNIISIHKTNNQKELAEIYSASNVFFNPTREDNYPTVNMEAISCGCPVVTFDTGGSSEMIDKENGIVLKEKTAKEAFECIEYINKNNIFNKEDCINYSKKFNVNDKFLEYVLLYEELKNLKNQKNEH